MARIYSSGTAAASSTVPRVWVVHVVCASVGAGMHASSATACRALRL
ncbi:hypothetical protein OAO87_00940 [bacterium]|nr:hypothetical protein [bacterium]